MVAISGGETLTEEQLRKIEARAAAATKGPWFKHGMFIAQSREDVPALVAEVRRLQTLLARPNQRELLLFQPKACAYLGVLLVAEQGTYDADHILAAPDGKVWVLGGAQDGTVGWIALKPGEFRWLKVSE